MPLPNVRETLQTLQNSLSHPDYKDEPLLLALQNEAINLSASDQLLEKQIVQIMTIKDGENNTFLTRFIDRLVNTIKEQSKESSSLTTLINTRFEREMNVVRYIFAILNDLSPEIANHVLSLRNKANKNAIELILESMHHDLQNLLLSSNLIYNDAKILLPYVSDPASIQKINVTTGTEALKCWLSITSILDTKLKPIDLTNEFDSSSPTTHLLKKAQPIPLLRTLLHNTKKNKKSINDYSIQNANQIIEALCNDFVYPAIENELITMLKPQDIDHLNNQSTLLTLIQKLPLYAQKNLFLKNNKVVVNIIDMLTGVHAEEFLKIISNMESSAQNTLGQAFLKTDSIENPFTLIPQKSENPIARGLFIAATQSQKAHHVLKTIIDGVNNSNDVLELSFLQIAWDACIDKYELDISLHALNPAKPKVHRCEQHTPTIPPKALQLSLETLSALTDTLEQENPSTLYEFFLLVIDSDPLKSSAYIHIIEGYCSLTDIPGNLFLLAAESNDAFTHLLDLIHACVPLPEKSPIIDTAFKAWDHMVDNNIHLEERAQLFVLLRQHHNQLTPIYPSLTEDLNSETSREKLALCALLPTNIQKNIYEKNKALFKAYDNSANNLDDYNVKDILGMPHPYKLIDKLTLDENMYPADVRLIILAGVGVHADEVEVHKELCDIHRELSQENLPDYYKYVLLRQWYNTIDKEMNKKHENKSFVIALLQLYAIKANEMKAALSQYEASLSQQTNAENTDDTVLEDIAAFVTIENISADENISSEPLAYNSLYLRPSTELKELLPTLDPAVAAYILQELINNFNPTDLDAYTKLCYLVMRAKEVDFSELNIEKPEQIIKRFKWNDLLAQNIKEHPLQTLYCISALFSSMSNDKAINHWMELQDNAWDLISDSIIDYCSICDISHVTYVLNALEHLHQEQREALLFRTLKDDRSSETLLNYLLTVDPENNALQEYSELLEEPLHVIKRLGKSSLGHTEFYKLIQNNYLTDIHDITPKLLTSSHNDTASVLFNVLHSAETALIDAIIAVIKEIPDSERLAIFSFKFNNALNIAVSCIPEKIPALLTLLSDDDINRLIARPHSDGLSFFHQIIKASAAQTENNATIENTFISIINRIPTESIIFATYDSSEEVLQKCEKISQKATLVLFKKICEAMQNASSNDKKNAKKLLCCKIAGKTAAQLMLDNAIENKDYSYLERLLNSTFLLDLHTQNAMLNIPEYNIMYPKLKNEESSNTSLSDTFGDIMIGLLLLKIQKTGQETPENTYLQALLTDLVASKNDYNQRLVHAHTLKDHYYSVRMKSTHRDLVHLIDFFHSDSIASAIRLHDKNNAIRPWLTELQRYEDFHTYDNRLQKKDIPFFLFTSDKLCALEDELSPSRLYNLLTVPHDSNKSNVLIHILTKYDEKTIKKDALDVLAKLIAHSFTCDEQCKIMSSIFTIDPSCTKAMGVNNVLRTLWINAFKNAENKTAYFTSIEKDMRIWLQEWDPQKDECVEILSPWFNILTNEELTGLTNTFDTLFYTSIYFILEFARNVFSKINDEEKKYRVLFLLLRANGIDTKPLMQIFQAIKDVELTDPEAIPKLEILALLWKRDTKIKPSNYSFELRITSLDNPALARLEQIDDWLAKKTTPAKNEATLSVSQARKKINAYLKKDKKNQSPLREVYNAINKRDSESLLDYFLLRANNPAPLLKIISNEEMKEILPIIRAKFPDLYPLIQVNVWLHAVKYPETKGSTLFESSYPNDFYDQPRLIKNSKNAESLIIAYFDLVNALREIEKTDLSKTMIAILNVYAHVSTLSYQDQSRFHQKILTYKKTYTEDTAIQLNMYHEIFSIAHQMSNTDDIALIQWHRQLCYVAQQYTYTLSPDWLQTWDSLTTIHPNKIRAIEDKNALSKITLKVTPKLQISISQPKEVTATEDRRTPNEKIRAEACTKLLEGIKEFNDLGQLQGLFYLAMNSGACKPPDVISLDLLKKVLLETNFIKAIISINEYQIPKTNLPLLYYNCLNLFPSDVKEEILVNTIPNVVKEMQDKKETFYIHIDNKILIEMNVAIQEKANQLEQVNTSEAENELIALCERTYYVFTASIRSKDKTFENILEIIPERNNADSMIKTLEILQKHIEPQKITALLITATTVDTLFRYKLYSKVALSKDNRDKLANILYTLPASERIKLFTDCLQKINAGHREKGLREINPVSFINQMSADISDNPLLIALFTLQLLQINLSQDSPQYEKIGNLIEILIQRIPQKTIDFKFYNAWYDDVLKQITTFSLPEQHVIDTLNTTLKINEMENLLTHEIENSTPTIAVTGTMPSPASASVSTPAPTYAIPNASDTISQEELDALFKEDSDEIHPVETTKAEKTVVKTISLDECVEIFDKRINKKPLIIDQHIRLAFMLINEMPIQEKATLLQALRKKYDKTSLTESPWSRLKNADYFIKRTILLMELANLPNRSTYILRFDPMPKQTPYLEELHKKLQEITSVAHIENLKKINQGLQMQTSEWKRAIDVCETKIKKELGYIDSDTQTLLNNLSKVQSDILQRHTTPLKTNANTFFKESPKKSVMSTTKPTSQAPRSHQQPIYSPDEINILQNLKTIINGTRDTIKAKRALPILQHLLNKLGNTTSDKWRDLFSEADQALKTPESGFIRSCQRLLNMRAANPKMTMREDLRNQFDSIGHNLEALQNQPNIR